MPPLSKEAQRLSIRISGRLEWRLMELARPLAAAQDAEEVSAANIEFALRQLAGDNASLWQYLLPEGENHVERRAG